jgi:hypothetical protein
MPFDLQIKYVATSLFDAAEMHHESSLPSKLQCLPVPERTIQDCHKPELKPQQFKKSISPLFCWADFFAKTEK